MSVAIIISAFLANLLTKVINNKKVVYRPEEKMARTTFLRLFNAVVGAVTVLVTAFLLGEPVETDSLAEYFEVIVYIGITFFTSQGAYFLAKR